MVLIQISLTTLGGIMIFVSGAFYLDRVISFWIIVSGIVSVFGLVKIRKKLSSFTHINPELLVIPITFGLVLIGSMNSFFPSMRFKGYPPNETYFYSNCIPKQTQYGYTTKWSINNLPFGAKVGLDHGLGVNLRYQLKKRGDRENLEIRLTEGSPDPPYSYFVADPSIPYPYKENEEKYLLRNKIYSSNRVIVYMRDR